MELEQDVGELSRFLKRDKEPYVFTVTEHLEDVAMLLVNKSNIIYINERAREKLRSLWRDTYGKNIEN